MSTEENQMPEMNPATSNKAKKTKEGYNGIYRRNTRVKKSTKPTSDLEQIQEESKTSVEQQPVVENSETSAPKKSSKSKKTNTNNVTEKKLTVKRKTPKVLEAEQDIKQPTTEEQTDIPTKEQTHTEAQTPQPEIKEEATKEDHVVTVRSPFHELLYLIRQKNAYNHNEFFFELEKVLENLKFDEIKESNLSLFGFACMYDREIIFHKLCKDYSNFIDQKDLESILKICFTKREETVGNLIKVYSERFKPSPEFIKELFNSMSISSYRENNNIQILEWLAPFLKEDEYECLWNKSIEHRNISLMNTALHVPLIKENLQKNFNKYSDGFKLLGREHTFARALNREYRKIPLTNANQDETETSSKKDETPDSTINPTVVFKSTRKDFKTTL